MYLALGCGTGCAFVAPPAYRMGARTIFLIGKPESLELRLQKMNRAKDLRRKRTVTTWRLPRDGRLTLAGQRITHLALS